MRDNFNAVWLRSEGVYRAKRLNDNAGMVKISRSYHIKIFTFYLVLYIV